MKCKNCAKDLLDIRQKFCSINCQDDYIKNLEQIVKEAKAAKANHAVGFCLVTAGKGLDDKRLAFVCEAARAVKAEVKDLKLIACNGTATLEQLQELKSAGVDNYNHNLETSRDFYKEICTTHEWDERYQTCLNAKEAGLKLVCGGIFGMGETQEDRISMLEAIASLDPMTVPLNFFHPNAALPIVKNTITKEEGFKLIETARKMLPNAHKIMIAGGREVMFGEEQYDVFKHGANSIVIGDYLTTAGKTPKEEIEAVVAAGYEIAAECDKK